MTKVTEKVETLVIAGPNLKTVRVDIVGVAPFVQHKFSAKAKKQMLDAQIAGSKGKNKRKKAPRDVKAEYEGAMRKTVDGKHGIHAASFRSAMISACRLVGFTMTKAKLSVFVDADGFDVDDGAPLVFINGHPEMNESPVRLDSGVASLAYRPMWREWSAQLRIKFDADQFETQDVINLISRAGLQVGIGEGRPDSKKSHGCGWGLFDVVGCTEFNGKD